MVATAKSFQRAFITAAGIFALATSCSFSIRSVQSTASPSPSPAGPLLQITSPAPNFAIRGSNAANFTVQGSCSEVGQIVSLDFASSLITATPACNSGGSWSHSFQIALQGHSAWIPQAGALVAHYKLNETLGTSGASSVIDSSGQNNHGTPNGAGITFGATGKLAACSTFDGSATASISIPSGTLPTGTQNRSITMWINPSTLPTIGNQACMLGWGAAAIHGAQMLCLYNDTGTQVIEYGGMADDFYYPQTIPTGQWTFLAFTFNGTDATITINNGAANVESHPAWNTILSNVTISGVPWLTGVEFNGKIDEIMIWNSVLTPTEIQSIYSTQEGTYIPNGSISVTADHQSASGQAATQAVRNFVVDDSL